MVVKTKICTRCKQELPIDYFSDDTRKDGRKLSQCIKCRNYAQKLKRKSQLSNPYRKRQWALATLRSHRKSGYNINITTDELTELAEEITHCRWCGRKLQWESGKGVTCHCPTLDRTDNGQTIDIDNIDIICLGCNASKGQLTENEFKEHIKRMYEVSILGCKD